MLTKIMVVLVLHPTPAGGGTYHSTIPPISESPVPLVLESLRYQSVDLHLDTTLMNERLRGFFRQSPKLERAACAPTGVVYRDADGAEKEDLCGFREIEIGMSFSHLHNQALRIRLTPARLAGQVITVFLLPPLPAILAREPYLGYGGSSRRPAPAAPGRLDCPSDTSGLCLCTHRLVSPRTIASFLLLSTPGYSRPDIERLSLSLAPVQYVAGVWWAMRMCLGIRSFSKLDGAVWCPAHSDGGWLRRSVMRLDLSASAARMLVVKALALRSRLVVPAIPRSYGRFMAVRWGASRSSFSSSLASTTCTAASATSPFGGPSAASDESTALYPSLDLLSCLFPDIDTRFIPPAYSLLGSEPLQHQLVCTALASHDAIVGRALPRRRRYVVDIFGVISYHDQDHEVSSLYRDGLRPAARVSISCRVSSPISTFLISPRGALSDTPAATGSMPSPPPAARLCPARQSRPIVDRALAPRRRFIDIFGVADHLVV
ncbi:hypothetical protein R3P38DRAFT_3230803 [Favolaschia claudopus]|uniref:Uncharacterized protein n=1 Tax=Favolaschia claudopus TaxID=2862362 RepID=A0AAV9ZLQ2_9AGAR